ncbi:MAG: VWA domain-containing protein [Myxococcota bacterium]
MKTALRIGVFALLALAVVVGGLAAFIGADLRYVVFAQPLWFAVAAVPMLAVVIRQAFMPRPATMKFSRARSLGRLRGGFMARLAYLPDGLRVAAGVLLVACLARPQSTRGSDRIKHEGIDIVLVLDLSESMQNSDIPPTRLAAAQAVVDDFIARRPRDRISLVAFGSAVSTLAPLTMDHGVLRTLVSRLRIGMIDGTHTAIGDGLGVALNRLEDSEAESQIVVLLTDGLNNWGENNPDTVASEASERGVKVFTVLMGRDLQGADGSVDAGQLERIASVTGGFSYTAVDQAELRGSFQDLLDKLERSTIEGNVVRPERFEWFLWPALFLLLLDIGLRTTRLRRFP